MEWEVYTSHLFAERRVPPGAIFREKIEGRWYTTTRMWEVEPYSYSVPFSVILVTTGR